MDTAFFIVGKIYFRLVLSKLWIEGNITLNHAIVMLIHALQRM